MHRLRLYDNAYVQDHPGPLDSWSLNVEIGIVGLSTHNTALIEKAFDILALEALFMVPRVCSILSLSPYWGTLIPCLKEMGKDFIK